MKLLIVIVNYRSADLTIDCLRSLAPEIASLGDGVRVIITDNQSPDDSVPKLTAALHSNGWQWATLMPLPRNGGFAYGNNAAIAPALAAADKPDYFLLLNPDTLVRPGAIAALLDFLDTHPTVGIAGSRLEDPDGTPQRSAFRFPSVRGEWERSVRLGVFSKLLSKHVMAPPVVDSPLECDWVAGASMLVRRAVFETAGGAGLMDERFFMYFEEVDFCLAAKRAGWPCWYVPASRVVHLVGAVSQLSDSRKHRKRRPAYWFESRRHYWMKNHGWLRSAAADVTFLVGFSLWRLRRALQRKEDPDPPHLLTDQVYHSVLLRRGSAS